MSIPKKKKKSMYSHFKQGAYDIAESLAGPGAMAIHKKWGNRKKNSRLTIKGTKAPTPLRTRHNKKQ